MQNDKALQKILLQTTEGLPNGFENRMMARITLEAARKKRRATLLSFSLVSVVSMVLIGSGYYVLNRFFSFDIHLSLPGFEPSAELWRTLSFSAYIAVLVLILLMGDLLMRRFKQRQSE